MDPLDVLRRADFDWVARLDDVWRDVPYDVSEIHETLRRAVLDRCLGLEDRSALGMVLLGPAGSGKTHLLGALRGETLRAGAYFILVDLSGPKGFWESVPAGYLNSLREPAFAPQGRSIFTGLLKRTGFSREKARKSVDAWVKAPQASQIKNIRILLGSMARLHQREATAYQDVIRAFILFNSDDFYLSNIGYCWLSGLGLDESEAEEAGLRQRKTHPVKIIEGLSWIVSLAGPAVLAFDQLDAMVDRGRDEASNSRIEPVPYRVRLRELSPGLAASIDHTRRTLPVISCLETTWDEIRQVMDRAELDRFQEPMRLGPIVHRQAAVKLVKRRMAAAFSETGFVPDHPTWPFAPSVFEDAVGLTPRTILKHLEAHRRHCLVRGRIEEMPSIVGGSEPAHLPESQNTIFIDEMYYSLKAEADVERLLAEENEAELGRLLASSLTLLEREASLTENMELAVETDIEGAGPRPGLHARLTFSETGKDGSAFGLSFRVLQATHPGAYQARVKAALKAAGLDGKTASQQLVLLRSHPPPQGPACRRTTGRLLASGGLFIDPTDDDVACFQALSALERIHPEGFDQWLGIRRPATRLDFLQQIMAERSDRIPIFQLETEKNGRSEAYRSLSLGTVPGRKKKIVSLPLKALSRHTVIIGGSGKSRSVLIRRLCEMTVLSGLPVVLVDPEAHQTLPPEIRPRPHLKWLENDSALAEIFPNRVDTVVWTAAPSEGRPVSLPLLPDNTPHQPGKVDEFGSAEEAVTLALGNLAYVTGDERPDRSARKKAVLTSALTFFYEQGGFDLDEFIRLLDHLPDAVGGKSQKIKGLAREMAGLLKTGPASSLSSVKPGEMLRLDELLRSDSGQPRFSIVGLAGLETKDLRRQFMGQLVTAVFSWLKKQRNRSLKGLLVLDRVDEFIEPQAAHTCREALKRLARLAGPRGLGLVFSASNPAGIDFKAVNHFSTWFIGPPPGSARTAALEKILKERGGRTDGLKRLPAGRFYLVSDGLVQPPVEFRTAESLTRISL